MGKKSSKFLFMSCSKTFVKQPLKIDKTTFDVDEKW